MKRVVMIGLCGLLAAQVLAVLIVASTGQITVTTTSTLFETLASTTIPADARGITLSNQGGASVYVQTSGNDATTTTSMEVADGQAYQITGRKADLQKTELICASDTVVVSYMIITGDTTNHAED